MPTELTVIAVTALLAGLLAVALVVAGRGIVLEGAGPDGRHPEPSAPDADGAASSHDGTMRVVWWLTITIVLLGVGISGSFAADQAPIFLLGAAGVAAVIVFHELIRSARRARGVRFLELLTALALVAGLLVLTGYASSPFAILFALVAVAAALGFGPRAGFAAAGLATVAFGGVLALDPQLPAYGPADALRLSLGLGTTWLLAFVAVAYATHQRRALRRIIDLSRTDPLTGLFNRSQLFLTLEQEVSRTRRSDRGFCVLMIDLDGLKLINDSDGHLRGDQVLRQLGTIIAGSIRTVDSAYRYGGDEFVVLLPETDIVGAFVVAEKIRLGAEELEISPAGSPLASVSIGLVSHPEDGLNAEELMAAADRAMYQAKSLGKNQISGNPRPRPALLSRRSTLEPAHPPPAPASPPPDATPPPDVTSRPTGEAGGPPSDRAVAVPLGPIREPDAAPEAAPEATPEAAPDGGDDEADPQEVRRRIAAASRSFDPDDQVRRAMDAFFSPTVPPRPPDAERASPEH